MSPVMFMHKLGERNTQTRENRTLDTLNTKQFASSRIGKHNEEAV